MRKSLKTAQKLEILYLWFINSSDIDACTHGEKFCFYFQCCEEDNEEREARCLHEKKIMIELPRPVEQKSITGKNITKNLELTSKERYIFWLSDTDAERLKYEKHFQWYIQLKSTHSGVEYTSWEKIVLKPRPCDVV